MKTPVSNQKPGPAKNAVSAHKPVSTQKPVSINVEDFLSQVVEKYGTKDTVVLPPNSGYNNVLKYKLDQNKTSNIKFKEQTSSGKRVAITDTLFNLFNIFCTVNNVVCIINNDGCIVNNDGCTVNNVR